MTSKPMLSVELRALLERLLSHDFAEECQECGIGYSDAWGELRAILDKEVDMDSDASKHQGEPVAWLNIATGYVTTSAVVVMDRDDEKEQVQSLYAEQPAPVAVVIPERREPSPSNPHLSDADYEYNSALDDVARLNGVKP